MVPYRSVRISGQPYSGQSHHSATGWATIPDARVFARSDVDSSHNMTKCIFLHWWYKRGERVAWLCSAQITGAFESDSRRSHNLDLPYNLGVEW